MGRVIEALDDVGYAVDTDEAQALWWASLELVSGHGVLLYVEDDGSLVLAEVTQ